MNRPEHHIQAQAVAWFRWQYPALRPLLFAIPNGAFLNGNARDRAMRWAFLEKEGANKGTADLFLAIASPDCPGIFFETKAPGGRQSEEQKAFEKAVTAQGYAYVVYSRLEDFQNIVRNQIRI